MVETELHPDRKMSLAFKRVIRHRKSNFQEIMVLDTEGFGRVLVIDGKPQSAEADRFVYYESFVHPALLKHDNPKKVFIMGGGEGSAAREVLRHKMIEKVIYAKETRLCFEENWVAFSYPRLEIITSDAREFLEYRKDKYDLIIGDMPVPIEGCPCHDLYTKYFSESVIKPRLNDGGIFVTRLAWRELKVTRSLHPYTIPFNWSSDLFCRSLLLFRCMLIPADGLCLLVLTNAAIEERINARVKGELRYHDSASILAATIMNKIIWKELHNYIRNHIMDEDMTMIDNWCKNARGNA